MSTSIAFLLRLVIAITVAIGALASIVPSDTQAYDSSRPVLAYYYGWYTPDNWHNTSDLPPDTYDSWSDQTMRRQIEQARSVGITGFICTWEYNCERLLQIAEEMGGFSIAMAIDPAAEHKLSTWDKLIDGFNRMKALTDSPAYLRWNGKPVFVFWNSQILPGSSGVSDFERLRNTVDPNRSQFWLGGGTDFRYLDVFDAIHFYDISWESSQGAAMASYNRNLDSYNASHGTSKPFVATVMPGYDDRQLRGGHHRPRENGAYYNATWDDAIRYDAQAIVITSWNEWFEGSQIEPSRSYGNRYLDITRQRTAHFRTAPGKFTDPAFERTWSREDRPIVENRVNRTWVWGYGRREAFTESYNGRSRQVMYFDKARMEINDPNGDRSSLWFVTNGLLAKELITGRMQVGDTSFEERGPAHINVAGDSGDPNGPTYATFANLLNEPPIDQGTLVTEQVGRDSAVTPNDSLGGHGVTGAYYVPQTNHTVASVFWEYMNSEGLVYQNGGFTTSKLFANPFYATGFPITEAYWTHVRVAGNPQDVLVQCFERRCLTYTPGNPNGWKVEMGNIGQHYHRWRYGWSW